MLEPLKQYVCDHCNQVIETPEDGWVEWLQIPNKETGHEERQGFKIVHRSRIENGQRVAARCYFYDNNPHRCDNHLDVFLGDRQMQLLTGFLDPGVTFEYEYNGPGVANMREYVEFMRRLTLPYYEEARLYWSEAKNNGELEGHHEMSAYSPEFLKNIISEYADRDE